MRMRLGSDQSYRRRSHAGPLPSVTSAQLGPWSCTLSWPSSVLPKSSERPGPKSVTAAMNCSGVAGVGVVRWIVGMRAPYRMIEDKALDRARPRIVGTTSAVGHGTLTFVDVRHFAGAGVAAFFA